MDHHAAVELGPGWGIGYGGTGEPVFEAQDVVRVREVAVEMAELFVELAVPVVAHLEYAILDAKGVRVVLARRMLGDLGGPAGKVAAVEQRVPLALVRGRQCRSCAEQRQCQSQNVSRHAIPQFVRAPS